MAVKERFPMNPPEPTVIGVDKACFPFNKMYTVLQAEWPHYFFTPLELRFGGIDFEVTANQNSGDVPGDDYAEDIFFEIGFKCRIKSLEELAWLQRYEINMVLPPHSVTVEKDNNPKETKEIQVGEETVLLSFDETWPYELEYIESELEQTGFVDMGFETEFRDFALKSKELREKIKLEVLNKTTSPGQQELPGFLKAT